MPDTLTPYSINCSMTKSQTVLAQAMIESKYSEIKMTVSPDADKEKGGLVGFTIPRESVAMNEFFGDLYRALNPESKISAQPERRG